MSAPVTVTVTPTSPVSDDLLGVAGAIVAKDAGVWGPEAREESAHRLGWLDLPESSRALLPRVAALRDELLAAGVDHVVLAGMGGSSLAPEVITRTAGVELTILDTTDPHQVATALADRIASTVVVVSSKSGGTVETDSHRRVYTQAFRDAGLSDADVARRVVVVTDPGSPLEAEATAAGHEVFLADPDVGGRYSALSAFGIVPSGLAGADVDGLLADARALAESLASDTGNPALELGAVLGQGAVAGRDKLVLADGGSGIVGFGDWAEQLVAESTGKQGRGLLPVVVEQLDAPGFADAGKDAQRVVIGAAGVDPANPTTADAITVTGPLGAQFLLWEFATAVAGRVLEINPFDQPNVAESKDNTKAILDGAGDDGPLPDGDPAFTDGSIEVYGDVAALGGHSAGNPTDITDIASVLRALLGAVPERGYLAIMAYLDREAESAAASLRLALAARLGGRATTFGWGPRFLHSTGQFHKGGPQVGAFLQITGAVERDLDVPGRPFSLGRLQRAQALGDLRALQGRNRPVVRLHLLDRAAGLEQLVAVAGSLGTPG